MKKAYWILFITMVLGFYSCQTIAKTPTDNSPITTEDTTEVPDSSIGTIPALSPSMSLMLSPVVDDPNQEAGKKDDPNPVPPSSPQTNPVATVPPPAASTVVPSPTPVQAPISSTPTSSTPPGYVPPVNTTNSNPYNLPLPSNGAPVSGAPETGMVPSATAVTANSDLPATEIEKGTEVRAASGTPVIIRIDEEGWVFLEDTDSSDLLSFSSRRLDETTKQTVFEFAPLKEGSTILRFQLQNLLKGYIRVKEIPVVIGKESMIVTDEKKESLDKADELFWAGKYKEALDMYQKLNKPSTAEVRDRIALTQWALGQFKDAVANWKSNLNDPQFTSPALKGLSVAALIGEPSSPLSALPTDLWKKLTPEDRTDLLEVIKKDKRILPENALKFFEMIPWESGLEPDYWLYKMGQWYEQNGPMRNVKKAKGYYTRLTEEYPLSDYYNPSTERIDYIDRHFFLIN